jgi:hypothetical protein
LLDSSIFLSRSSYLFFKPHTSDAGLIASGKYFETVGCQMNVFFLSWHRISSIDLLMHAYCRTPSTKGPFLPALPLAATSDDAHQNRSPSRPPSFSRNSVGSLSPGEQPAGSFHDEMHYMQTNSPASFSFDSNCEDAHFFSKASSVVSERSTDALHRHAFSFPHHPSASSRPARCLIGDSCDEDSRPSVRSNRILLRRVLGSWTDGRRPPKLFASFFSTFMLHAHEFI